MNTTPLNPVEMLLLGASIVQFDGCGPRLDVPMSEVICEGARRLGYVYRSGILTPLLFPSLQRAEVFVALAKRKAR